MKGSPEMKKSLVVLQKSLQELGISKKITLEIVQGVEINIVNREYLTNLELRGKILSATIRLIKNYYFNSFDVNRVANSNNFFSINEKFVYFDGIDINPRRIKINKHIEKIMKRYGYERNGDIVELFDDDSVNFFNDVYLKY